MNVRQLAARVDPGTLHPRGSPQPTPSPPNRAGAFAEELRRAQEGRASESLNISAHARQRIEQRAISFTDEDRNAVSEAVRHLAEKGSRDALLLRGDAAFVVNVPNRTLVTAVPQAELRERVFTNIDSAMLL